MSTNVGKLQKENVTLKKQLKNKDILMKTKTFDLVQAKYKAADWEYKYKKLQINFNDLASRYNELILQNKLLKESNENLQTFKIEIKKTIQKQYLKVSTI